MAQTPQFLEFARSTPSPLSQVIPGLTLGVKTGTDLAKTIQDVKTAQQQRQFTGQLMPLEQALLKTKTEREQAETAQIGKEQALTPLDMLRAEKLQSEIAQLQKEPLSPFEEEQQKAFSKQLGDVNQQAEISQKTIGKMNTLSSILEKMPLKPGLVSGSFLLTTPEGQEFIAALRDAQLDLIKQVHLGRMTQKEFDYIQSIIGSKHFFPAALRSIFDKVRARSQMDIGKQKYASEYLKEGKKDPITFETAWLDKVAQQENKSGFPLVSEGHVPNIDLRKTNVTAEHPHALSMYSKLGNYGKSLFGIETPPSIETVAQPTIDETKLSDADIERLLKERGLT